MSRELAMSAEAAAACRSFSVGRYTVTLTVPTLKAGVAAAVVVEWTPELPERLTAAEVAEYVRGRNAVLVALGLPVLVIEA
jgi:hypothetical protein